MDTQSGKVPRGSRDQMGEHTGQAKDIPREEMHLPILNLQSHFTDGETKAEEYQPCPLTPTFSQLYNRPMYVLRNY